MFTLERINHAVEHCSMVIVPATFNLYTYDIPTTVSRKYIYADDIAMMGVLASC